MDLDTLRFRSRALAETRAFFSGRGYLETDAPALCAEPIPETCLELFRADYLVPWREGPESIRPLFLLPSPEAYLKRLLADHGVSLFQISKCYRNVESVGRIHSPEFTMLEYYTVGANYLDSIALTEEYLLHLRAALWPSGGAPAWLEPPFARVSVDEAFERHAGFRLSACPESADLARRAAALGLGDEETLARWAWDDLYELILVHSVEPPLAAGDPVFLTDYPARVPCLAAERVSEALAPDGRAVEWRTKERWELYARGVELANCYTEERDPGRVARYLESERAEKDRTARVPHPVPKDFPEVCARMPPSSGVAMGLDRLVMALAGRSAIDAVLPFPLSR